MSTTRERIIIERKGPHGFVWDVIAHPENSAGDALATLAYLESAERKKPFPGKLRVVKEIREIMFERDCTTPPQAKPE